LTPRLNWGERLAAIKPIYVSSGKRTIEKKKSLPDGIDKKRRRKDKGLGQTLVKKLTQENEGDLCPQIDKSKKGEQMIAVKALPLDVAAAKERQGTRTDLTQKIAESYAGEAREKAAQVFGTNRQYVDDAIKAPRSPRVQRTVDEWYYLPAIYITKSLRIALTPLDSQVLRIGKVGSGKPGHDVLVN